MSNGDRDVSREEEDLRERNTKKVKGGEYEFLNASTVPISYDDLVEPMEEVNPVMKSYKETVLGIDAGSGSNGDKLAFDHDDRDATGVNGDSGEYSLGDMNLISLPEIVVPPSAEERLCKPWRQGLLVKLLGRRIGFKALEIESTVGEER